MELARRWRRGSRQGVDPPVRFRELPSQSPRTPSNGKFVVSCCCIWRWSITPPPSPRRCRRVCMLGLCVAAGTPTVIDRQPAAPQSTKACCRHHNLTAIIFNSNSFVPCHQLTHPAYMHIRSASTGELKGRKRSWPCNGLCLGGQEQASRPQFASHQPQGQSTTNPSAKYVFTVACLISPCIQSSCTFADNRPSG